MDTIVEEPKTETTTTDPDASKGFGEIMQARLEQKTAAKSEEKTPTETAPEPAKEATKEPPKEPAPATTPIGDVLDAALSKAAPEPPKEPSPEDEFADVTEGVKSETVKQRMIGMRGKIKTLWEENQTRSRELAELASKVKPPMESEEVKTLLKAKDEEIARANEALLALNIDSHPEFQREFTQPRQKLAQNAAKKLQGYGGNGQALIDALYMPEGIRRDEAISELLENVPDYAKGKITGIVTEIEGLDDRAQEKRANAPKTWEELSARDIEARRKKAEEYRGQVTGMHEKVVQKLSETPFFRQFPEEIKGASEWNNARKSAFERGVNHILGSDNTVERSLETAVKGEHFDFVTKMLSDKLSAERDLRIAAERKVAEYEGVQPKVGGGSAPVAKETDDDKDLPFGEIMARRAARRSSEDAD